VRISECLGMQYGGSRGGGDALLSAAGAGLELMPCRGQRRMAAACTILAHSPQVSDPSAGLDGDRKSPQWPP